jgi:hypothetical protein
MSRLALVAFVAALALTAAACGGKHARGQGASRSSATTSPRLTNLRDIGQLRSLFNTRSGEPRLIVLVSPT